VARALPSGSVTFLFTDVEGSTKLLHELGVDAYSSALLEHRRILRAAFTRHGGVEVDTQGDAFFIAFPEPSGAVDAARAAQEALRSGPISVRIGIHSGNLIYRTRGTSETTCTWEHGSGRPATEARCCCHKRRATSLLSRRQISASIA